METRDRLLNGQDSETFEMIENNLRRVIIEEQAINPIYYTRMLEPLNILIQQIKADALSYEQYLRLLVELTRQAANPTNCAAYLSHFADSPCTTSLVRQSGAK